mgnify:CR=1 FL=1
MKYSLIIAVYNRKEEVKELLDSAERIDFPRDKFELVFSDDGSTDGFQGFINDYETKSDLNIRSIKQENKGPGAARNHGMRKAKGQYFIFVDSDCLFPSNYLKEIDKALLKSDYDAFGGPDACHPDFPDLLKAINYSMTSFIGTGGTRGQEKSITKFYPRSFNMGIKRTIFETIGGMNQLRHGQDMDFSARIYEAGYKVGLIPTAFVYHKRRTSLKKFFKQIFNWGVARINLGKSHPQLLKPVHFAPSLILLCLLKLIILAPFMKISRNFLKIAGLGAFGVASFAFGESFGKYENKKVSFLSVITLFTQVLAYGLGILWGLWQIRQGKTARGFSKNYYK